MQLAEILSDLVSLRPGVCDPAAALALVSARASTSEPHSTHTTPVAHDEVGADANENDADLRRAQELVALHYDVREACKRGDLSRGLAQARRDVERALGG